jgi:hypothetical protein
MMRRTGQQVKSLAVIYVIGAFLDWPVVKTVLLSMMVTRDAIRRQ